MRCRWLACYGCVLGRLWGAKIFRCRLPECRKPKRPRCPCTQPAQVQPTQAQPAQAQPAQDSTRRPLPRATDRGRVSPPSAERVLVRFTASRTLEEKLMLARDLMSHANPSGDLATVVEAAVDLLIAERMKRKFGHTKRVGKPRAAKPSRVTDATKREVVARDGLQCAFVDDKGRRCSARGFLELDHETTKARGGSSRADNIRVLCSAHNQGEAERTFGRRYIERCRKRRDLTVRDAARATYAPGSESTRDVAGKSDARGSESTRDVAGKSDAVSWSGLPRGYSQGSVEHAPFAARLWNQVGRLNTRHRGRGRRTRIACRVFEQTVLTPTLERDAHEALASAHQSAPKTGEATSGVPATRSARQKQLRKPMT